LADHYPNSTWMLDKVFVRPVLTSIVRHSDDRDTGTYGDIGAAAGVVACLTDWRARALGKDQQVIALRKSFQTLLFDIFQCLHRIAAINGNGAQTGESPAEKWNAQQFLFENGTHRPEIILQEHCLPGALVFRHDHTGENLLMLASNHFEADVAAKAQPDHH